MHLYKQSSYFYFFIIRLFRVVSNSLMVQKSTQQNPTMSPKSTLRILSISLLLSISIGLFAQEKPKKHQLNGYVKDLRTFFLFDGFKNLSQENRIHNRLNYRWFPNDKWTVGVELRTQLIYGEFPKFYNSLGPFIDLLNMQPDAVQTPNTYGKLLDPAQGILNLAWTPIDAEAVVLQSYADRLWVEYFGEKWQVRVGRQRINWGQNWVWNPNDLFNTYSFIDFDYEERPGSDAVRLQYFFDKITVDVAASFEEDIDNSIFATKVSWNQNNYDFQVIASRFRNEWVAAVGWAGNIGGAGFKGEASWFYSPNAAFDSDNGLVLATGIDYSFENGLLLQGEFLFNQFGVTETETGVLGNTFGGQQLSPKNLWTYKYAVFVNAGYALSPLLNVSLGGIINPSDGTYFLVPSFSWSLKQNLDFFVNLQYTGKQEFTPPLNAFYDAIYGSGNVRLKWSF